MHCRRSFLAAGCAVAAARLVRPALAQAWPSRPLRLVVPFPGRCRGPRRAPGAPIEAVQAATGAALLVPEAVPEINLLG